MMKKFLAIGIWSLGMVGSGMYLERNRKVREEERSWPTCCSADEQSLVQRLKSLVGDEHVVVGRDTAFYTKGARIGSGHASAVVRPGSFSEAAQVVQACVDAGVAVIPQGANTSLTGGSVPRDDTGRSVVVVNMRRLSKLIPLDAEARHVLAFSGAGIHDLSNLCDGMQRESHSVLGSIFLNPSVGGGVALGSGGTQLRKGPVYTERVLYLRVNEGRRVEVVDTLGLAPRSLQGVSVLEALDRGDGVVVPEGEEEGPGRASHDAEYPERVCRLDGGVSRFNADTRGVEAVRSEGKVLILASVHSTFPKPQRTQTLWIGCRDFSVAHALRRVCLESPEDLPSSLEYINRDAFDVIDRAGRVLCTFLHVFGIGQLLTTLWDLKKSVESLPGCDRLIDKLLYYVNPLMPKTLSPRLHTCGQKFDHNLLITVDDLGNGGFDRLLSKLEAVIQEQAPGAVEYYKCSPSEGDDAMHFRFVMGTAFRSYCSGRGLKGMSFDYALPKNYEETPELHGIDVLEKRMRVSHFGCGVFHEELIFPPGVTPVDAQKVSVKHGIDSLGGALPAEHGHGSEYCAPPATQSRWEQIDPTNSFNPGVGKSSPSARFIPSNNDT